MPLLSFTTEELVHLGQLFEPVAYGRRAGFCARSRPNLRFRRQTSEVGVGLVHHVGAQVQRRFVLEAKRVVPDRETPRPWRAQDGP